ncbi:hypothetical protein LSUE1_G009174 [Lachnellula suecica]|uniref:BTB domain-containing protein n=1 Tax=Lachnellula suecica TaxID=602035 RepID=A0A8T9C2I6_9HELO|nr:hypothetical protein LSUE1_G009174 [Lachnellula suecica]
MPEMETGLDIYGENFDCVCGFCCVDGDQSLEWCQTKAEIARHTEEVSRLLIGGQDQTRKIQCHDIVTLVVGPDHTKLKCHKVLLGFKSEYFDGACYGNFSTSETNEIRLEEENPTAIAVLISWLYTGHISQSCSIAPEELWVLGDRFLCSDFSNAVIRHLFSHCTRNHVAIKTVQYAYENTVSGSKLRAFIKDMILVEGPLNGALADEDDEEAWRDLIRCGGDLVIDIALEGSFNSYENVDKRPYYWKNQPKYLQPIVSRPIEDFLKGKPRDRKRKA